MVDDLAYLVLDKQIATWRVVKTLAVCQKININFTPFFALLKIRELMSYLRFTIEGVCRMESSDLRQVSSNN